MPTSDLPVTRSETVQQLGPTGYPIVKPVVGLSEFWDAAIGDQLRTASTRLDLGPNGPKVLGKLLAATIVLVLALVAALVIGRGASPLFILIFLSPLIIVFVRSLLTVRSDLRSGWRDGPAS